MTSPKNDDALVSRQEKRNFVDVDALPALRLGARKGSQQEQHLRRRAKGQMHDKVNATLLPVAVKSRWFDGFCVTSRRLRINFFGWHDWACDLVELLCLPLLPGKFGYDLFVCPPGRDNCNP